MKMHGGGIIRLEATGRAGSGCWPRGSAASSAPFSEWHLPLVSCSSSGSGHPQTSWVSLAVTLGAVPSPRLPRPQAASPPLLPGSQLLRTWPPRSQLLLGGSPWALRSPHLFPLSSQLPPGREGVYRCQGIEHFNPSRKPPHIPSPSASCFHSKGNVAVVEATIILTSVTISSVCLH